MPEKEISNVQVTQAEPGSQVMILTVDEKDVPAVLAAARMINPDDDVAGFLGAPLPESGPISGTGCKTTGGTFHPSDFSCSDSDAGGGAS